MDKARIRPHPKTPPAKDPKFLDFVRSRPCCVCGKVGFANFPIHPHHVVSRGAGGSDVPQNGKGPNVVPMCVYHHCEAHQVGFKKFQELWEIDLVKAAKSVWKQYSS